ncbi:transmembrane protein Pmi isoform X2 [Oratosquilla oratoria]|uniref:transmembrane protein Pmi isoform X2 n=1 Tax=Oratosquilla oratoria TaxID=337810 RepID=UPI003F774C75
MSDEEERESRSDLAIIREVYDSDSAHETFELELERALEAGVATIVIEPTTLGDETARWIAVGNCLHKTAVLSGFGSIVAGLIWQDSPYVCVPLGTLSLFCTGVYTVSWQFDPCCKYQWFRSIIPRGTDVGLPQQPVDNDTGRLSRLPLQSLTSASPIVLVRRNDSKRKILHSSVSLIAFSYCMWKLYHLYK